MGQKVNPIGLRLGINRNWSSRWFPNYNNMPKHIGEDHKLRAFIAFEYATTVSILFTFGNINFNSSNILLF